MGGNAHQAIHHGVARLYRSGSSAGLTDGELLARFVTHGDEAAFEALLSRHGPMVLGVCRSWLHDGHAAADAFQATLLVLVRRAGSVRVDRSLGPWLHGVATRVASRARARSARQQAEQEPSRDLPDPKSRVAPDDLGPILHEELGRLPSAYRDVIIHCHLNEFTHEQAAAHLGCPVGTVRSRLARGRALLRRRLERRGVDRTCLAGATWPLAFHGRVPAALVLSTLRTAAKVAAGARTSLAASATVAALTEGVVTSMIATKIKLAVSLVALTGLIAFGAGGASQLAAADPLKTATIALARADEPETSQRKPLEKPRGLDTLITIDFQGAAFDQVMRALSEAARMPITLDPRVLNAKTAATTTPVTIRADNVSIKTVLNLIVEPRGLTLVEFTVEQPFVLVTRSDEQSRETPTVVRTYAVGDLVLGESVQANPTSRDRPPRVDMTPLVELITGSIAPGTWRTLDAQGRTITPQASDSEPIGTITPFFLSVSLIVRHTPEVHQQVAQLLSTMRRLPAFQPRMQEIKTRVEESPAGSALSASTRVRPQPEQLELALPPDLMLDARPLSPRVEVGEEVQFTATVTNNGTTDARGIKVTAELSLNGTPISPDGTNPFKADAVQDHLSLKLPIDRLAPGERRTFPIVLRATEAGIAKVCVAVTCDALGGKLEDVAACRVVPARPGASQHGR